jgi:branched-chain amino acid transport system permease protein
MRLALLSKDRIGSRALAAILLGIVAGVLVTPFAFHGATPLNVAANIAISTVLVASFDLLLGYTGIVSFAQTMFFGIGAYGVAMSATRWPSSWPGLLAGVLLALLLSSLLALLIGLFSLRVRALFYAMITLAVASAFQTLVSQLSEYTGGEDGLSFSLPDLISPGTEFLADPVWGVTINGKLLCFYLIVLTSALLFLLLLRIVNSPFGRVLQAIRENDFRAEALGYKTVVYRSLSNVVSAIFATLAGAMLAVWLGYNGPDTSLSFDVMVSLLLMTVIGGMGTMYGALIGAALYTLAQTYLQELMKVASQAAAGLPGIGSTLAELLSPDRWLLWLGVLFVLSVYYFPNGVVGRLRHQQRLPGI